MNPAATSLTAYLDALASKAATPGGGAAAALAGAQAAALLEMVCNLSTGKRYLAVAAEIAQIQQQATAARARLLALQQQDMLAFAQVMQAYQLPAAERAQQLPAALQAAAQPALDMAAVALSLLPLAQALAQLGNPNLITDVGAAVHMVTACVHSAQLNVQVNLQALQADPHSGVVIDGAGMRLQLQEQLDQLQAQAGPIIQAVAARLQV